MIGLIFEHQLQYLITLKLSLLTVPVVGALTNIQTPVIRSMMSKMTSPDVQGMMTIFFSSVINARVRFLYFRLHKI